MKAPRIKTYLPVIPSADLEKSLRFWVDGLGFTANQKMSQDGRLIGCMVHNDDDLYFWLNQRFGEPIPKDHEGIRLYWTPANIHEMRKHLQNLGYTVTDIEIKDYGQTEFFVMDDDGYLHCFGVVTNLS